MCAFTVMSWLSDKIMEYKPIPTNCVLWDLKAHDPYVIAIEAITVYR